MKFPRVTPSAAKPTLFVALFAGHALCLGCVSLPPANTGSPQTHRFVVRQDQPTRTGAPRFETDLTVPTGTEEWYIEATCPACRRGLVSLSLRFDAPIAPDLSLALRPANEPASLGPRGTCIELDSERAEPPTSCTFQAGHGWDDDGARRGAPRGFRARVENRGPSLSAHLVIVVIDPLE